MGRSASTEPKHGRNLNALLLIGSIFLVGLLSHIDNARLTASARYSESSVALTAS